MLSNRPEPPTLTAGEKTDPLLEIFSGSASGSIQPPKSLVSPPPRFSEGLGNGASTAATAAIPPVAVRPSPHAQREANAFNRSEMAEQIRQSFDNLVKASPIGVPLMARKTPGSGPSPPLPLPFPPLHSPGAPALTHNSVGRLPLPPAPAPAMPPPSFGGFSFPRQVQQVQQQQQPPPRTMLTPPSTGNNNVLFQQSPILGLTRGVSIGDGGGEGDKNRVSTSEPASFPEAAIDKVPNAVETTAPQRPSSAASQGTSKKKVSSSSRGGGGSGPSRKRELASLLGSSPALHHHIGSGGGMTTAPLPTTMPVSGGDRLFGAEDDLTFEVTRFGRPRVAPLAYWSSERLVVGTKAAGAQGIDKGSASGDLLAASSSGKKTVKKNINRTSIGGVGGAGVGVGAGKRKKEEVIEQEEAVAAVDEAAVIDELDAPVAVRRGGGRGGRVKGRGAAAGRGGPGRGRGKAAAAAAAVAAKVEEEKEEEDNEYAFPEDEDIDLPSISPTILSPSRGGIASLAVAAGTKASAAAAVAKKMTKIAAPAIQTTTKIQKPQQQPPLSARPSSASPLHTAPTNNKTPHSTHPTNETDAAAAAGETPAPGALPVVKGVPQSVLAALAATPLAERPRRCGECISCLNPSRKQACQTMRALGCNPPLTRVSHKKKKHAPSTGSDGGGARAAAARIDDVATKGGIEKEKIARKLNNRKRSPSPSLPLPAAEDSEETINVIEQQQQQQQQQQLKQKRTFRKRKADTSVDTANNAGGTAGTGPVRRSTRQRSVSVEVTNGNNSDEQPTASALIDTASKGGDIGATTGGVAGDAVAGPSSQRNLNTAAAAGAGAAGEGGPSSQIPWTAEQVAALHRGWLEVAPNAKNFWQKVAAMVPGKSANDCFNKMYEKHPTPPAKKTAAGGGGGGRKLLAAVRGTGEQQAPEPIKVGVTSKQAVQNAVRKIARQQRQQQRAEEISAAAVAAGGGGPANKEVLANLEPSEEQQHRDKYIDQILRKRRGRALGMAPHRASRPPHTAGAGAGAAGGGGGGFRAGASGVAREVTAALAAAREDDPDRDSGEESDYYWSDAE